MYGNLVPCISTSGRISSDIEYISHDTFAYEYIFVVGEVFDGYVFEISAGFDIFTEFNDYRCCSVNTNLHVSGGC